MKLRLRPSDTNRMALHDWPLSERWDFLTPRPMTGTALPDTDALTALAVPDPRATLPRPRAGRGRQGCRLDPVIETPLRAHFGRRSERKERIFDRLAIVLDDFTASAWWCRGRCLARSVEEQRGRGGDAGSDPVPSNPDSDVASRRSRAERARPFPCRRRRSTLCRAAEQSPTTWWRSSSRIRATPVAEPPCESLPPRRMRTQALDAARPPGCPCHGAELAARSGYRSCAGSGAPTRPRHTVAI